MTYRRSIRSLVLVALSLGIAQAWGVDLSEFVRELPDEPELATVFREAEALTAVDQAPPPGHELRGKGTHAWTHTES